MEDPLTAVLKDPQQLDAVKFYALVGLKDLFQIMNSPEAGQPSKNRDKENETINVLLDFLKRKQERTDKTTPEEDDAFRYLRREAIRALGYTKYPSVKKNKVVGTQTAFELLRILRRVDVSPPVSLSEQVEAAIGLCQLKPRESLEYQIDTVAYHLGSFISEYADLYNQNAAKNERAGSWIYDSDRLSQALMQLQAEVPGNKNVNDMVTISLLVLHSIENKQGPSLQRLGDWLKQNRPSDDKIYKGAPDSVIPIKSSEG